jgi:hypothetical protein
MTGDASVLGSLHSVDGEGVVRMEDRLDTGCEPPQRLLLTMRDSDPQPGQPEQTVIEAQSDCRGRSDQAGLGRAEMPVNLLPAYGAGTQIHVEHLADYISGRELRNVEARWNELFPAYEAVGVT